LHKIAVANSFSGWAYNCKLAKGKASTSCLDQFNKGELREFFCETYGFEDPSVDPEEALQDGVKLSNVTRRLVSLYWALKEPLAEVDTHGRMYVIRSWNLNGKPVCRAAWRAARGAATNRHDMLSKPTYLNVLPPISLTLSLKRLWCVYVYNGWLNSPRLGPFVRRRCCVPGHWARGL
jgi:hypothetical protein